MTAVLIDRFGAFDLHTLALATVLPLDALSLAPSAVFLSCSRPTLFNL